MNQRNAELLRDQVLKTWNPPIGGMGGLATMAQTSVMQTLAFVFGLEFLGQLTFEQHCTVVGGLKLMETLPLNDSIVKEGSSDVR